MKQFIFLFLSFPFLLFSQEKKAEITVNTPYYKAVDKWVIRPDTKSPDEYRLLFMYIDPDAGFTAWFGPAFHYKNGKYKLTGEIKDYDMRFRIQKDWGVVGIIPNEIIKELRLPKEPEWLYLYKEGQKSVSYKVRMGYFYNHIGECEKALEYLEPAYKEDPDAEGCAFEISYAYNHIRMFKKALPILKRAIKKDPTNPLYYKELGFTYKYLEEFDKSEEVFEKGMKKVTTDEIRAEMAYNMSYIFYQLKNEKKFEKWIELAKKYVEKGSEFEPYIYGLEEFFNQTNKM